MLWYLSPLVSTKISGSDRSKGCDGCVDEILRFVRAGIQPLLEY